MAALRLTIGDRDFTWIDREEYTDDPQLRDVRLWMHVDGERVGPFTMDDLSSNQAFDRRVAELTGTGVEYQTPEVFRDWKNQLLRMARTTVDDRNTDEK